jgi:hypothetical protein
VPFNQRCDGISASPRGVDERRGMAAFSRALAAAMRLGPPVITIGHIDQAKHHFAAPACPLTLERICGDSDQP